MLNRECLEEFKKLWFLEYGREIDDKVAEKIAVKFLTMMGAIYKPVPKADAKVLDKYENRIKQK